MNFIFKKVRKWINDFYEDTEEIFRMANIAGVIEDDDKKLMKDFRKEIKKLNEKK